MTDASTTADPTIATEEQRSHNLPPDISLLPSTPPPPSSDQIEAVVTALVAPETPLPYDAAKHAAFRLRVSLFSDACGKWADLKKITTEEQAKRLTDFFTGSRELFKQVEDQRKDDKKPYDDAGNVIQAAYKPLTDTITNTMKTLAPMQSDWIAREKARIEAEKAEAARIAREQLEEAQRKAAIAAANNDVMGGVEAAAALKAATKAEKAAAKPVKVSVGSASGAGRAMSARTLKHAVIVNQNAVYMRFREDPRVVELLQSLATAAVRSGEEFPETVLTVEEKVSVA